MFAGHLRATTSSSIVIYIIYNVCVCVAGLSEFCAPVPAAALPRAGVPGQGRTIDMSRFAVVAKTNNKPLLTPPVPGVRARAEGAQRSPPLHFLFRPSTKRNKRAVLTF